MLYTFWARINIVCFASLAFAQFPTQIRLDVIQDEGSLLAKDALWPAKPLPSMDSRGSLTKHQVPTSEMLTGSAGVCCNGWSCLKLATDSVLLRGSLHYFHHNTALPQLYHFYCNPVNTILICVAIMCDFYFLRSPLFGLLPLLLFLLFLLVLLLTGTKPSSAGTTMGFMPSYGSMPRSFMSLCKPPHLQIPLAR